MKISKKEVKQIIQEEIDYLVEQRSGILNQLVDKVYDFTKTDFFDTTDSGPGMTTREKYEKETQNALEAAKRAAGAIGVLALAFPVARVVRGARAANAATAAAKSAQSAGNLTAASSQAAAANVAAQKTADIVRKELAAAGVKKPGLLRRLFGLGAKTAVVGGAYQYGKSSAEDEKNEKRFFQKAKEQLSDPNSITNMGMALTAMGISNPDQILKKNMRADAVSTIPTRGAIPSKKRIKVKVTKKPTAKVSTDPDALPAEKFGDK